MAPTTAEKFRNAYRERLLKVLLSGDIKQIIHELNIKPFGDALENRYGLLREWDQRIEWAVLTMINKRLAYVRHQR